MRRLRRAHHRLKKKREMLKRRAMSAGTAVAITLGVGAASLNKVFAKDKADKHQQSIQQDADADLLADREEVAIGYLPFVGDQNRNTVRDGVELAERCATVIGGLYVYFPGTMMPIPNTTYRVQHAMFGVERCDICGQEVNMGGSEIINPMLGLRYPDPNDPLDGALLPDLALHYMKHGSLDCFGDVHSGRVDVARLVKILEMPRQCGDLGTIYLPADLNKDCQVDSVDFLKFIERWLHDTDPNQDQ